MERDSGNKLNFIAWLLFFMNFKRKNAATSSSVTILNLFFLLFLKMISNTRGTLYHIISLYLRKFKLELKYLIFKYSELESKFNFTKKKKPGYIFLLSILIFFSCQEKNYDQNLQKELENLKTELANQYKPGLGTSMRNFQYQHEKLWFSGIHQNWELADFAMHELEEELEDLKIFSADKPEVDLIDMIISPLTNVKKAIDNKDENLFRTHFESLTNTCNTCHKATDHGFIVITIPSVPAYSNQVFEVKKEEDTKKKI